MALPYQRKRRYTKQALKLFGLFVLLYWCYMQGHSLAQSTLTIIIMSFKMGNRFSECLSFKAQVLTKQKCLWTLALPLEKFPFQKSGPGLPT